MNVEFKFLSMLKFIPQKLIFCKTTEVNSNKDVEINVFVS
jgi:hypothetical protein